MNDYKERYELLNKNIEEIKINKHLFEEKLKIKEVEYKTKEDNIDELRDELIEMEKESYKILKSKEKIIDTATNILTLALIVGITSLSGFLYSSIAPISIIAKILTISGLTSGGVSFFYLGFSIIKITDINLKKKNISKNKNKQEYKDLTEEINKKNNKLSEKLIELKQIKKEINRLNNDLNGQKKLLSVKEKKLVQLTKEIVKTVINEEPIPEEITLTEEMNEESKENTKPYTRVKRGIGHRR